MPSATASPLEVIRTRKVIAVVGASKNPEKDANSIPAFLREHGYRVVPINPAADEILGERAFPSLASMPEQLAKEVEVIEVFRPSEELPQVARQVVELSKKYGRTYVFWAQAGLENDEAKAILTAEGIPYVMNACMRVVYGIAMRSS
ncbi:MAG: CoA-binding protein [Thaumarchaeota archaeon]|nr:CoA-binding protein [Nitrososphaerota archaeon]